MIKPIQVIGCWPVAEPIPAYTRYKQICSGCNKLMIATKEKTALLDKYPAAKILCYHCIAKAKKLLEELRNKTPVIEITN